MTRYYGRRNRREDCEESGSTDGGGGVTCGCETGGGPAYFSDEGRLTSFSWDRKKDLIKPKWAFQGAGRREIELKKSAPPIPATVDEEGVGCAAAGFYRTS